MSDPPNMAAITDTGLAPKRIDLLLALNGNFIALTFAVLAVVNATFAGHGGVLPFFPLALLGLLAGATALLRVFYQRQATAGENNAAQWERRYTVLALIVSAVWGIGGLIWYTPGNPDAQHWLIIIYIGMAVAEGQVRFLSRTAHTGHMVLALGPLIIRLALASPAEAGAAISLAATGVALVFYAIGVRHRYAALFARESRIDLRLAAMAHAKSVAETERDAAQERVRLKTAFVCGVSHELRTPLNAFLGMAQVLERGDLTSTQRNQARILMEAGRGFQTLLDDILIMAEDSPDGKEPTPADIVPPTCDPAVVVRTITRLLQPIIWERRLHLNVTTANGLPRITISAQALRQVLLKLVENAVKFTPDGAIEIITEAVQKNGNPLVRFTVSDSGLGVPPEIIPSLFDSRLHSSMANARGAGQSGIGLAVAKRIIEAVDGEIGFESALGEGSTFWFTVPVAAGRGEEDDDGPGSTTVRPPADLSLLIALPSRTTQKEIEDVLAPYGNRLQFTTGPADLATRATRESFDAIITTVDMAGMLSATPGEKAPVLALSPPGDNKPAATATATLAWPCAAWRLYAALKAIRRLHTEPAASSVGQTEMIDSIAVAELEKSVGAATLVEIFRTYLETSEKVRDEVADAAVQEDWETIGRVARDIVGSASGLGLAGVTASARAFAVAQREAATDDTLQKLAQAIIADSERTREALIALHPELAEAGAVVEKETAG